MNDSFQITAKCLSGMESILANELETLGAKGIQAQTRAVFFQGNTELLYAANLLF
jgi:putative N6-adenine-specific DNA methylase